jgi:hypothetical protein
MLFFALPNVKLRFTISKEICPTQNISILFSILIFAIIWGLRYGGGIDHLGYLERYQFYQDKDMWWVFKHFQMGFRIGSEIMGNLNLHYSFYFGFWAFLQALFIFIAFQRNQKEITPFLVITFLLGGIAFSFMNLIRQALAFSFFIFSIEFISRRKIIIHFLLVLIAFSFHKSAILLIPIYFLYYKKDKIFFKRIWVQYLLLCVSLFILSQNYIENIFWFMMKYADYFGYGHYAEKIFNGNQILLFSLERGRGLGFYIILLHNIIIIGYSKKLKSHFSSWYFSILYDLFFIGIIYGYISNGSIILTRINFYFNNITFIITAYALYYFYINIKGILNNKFLFWGLIAIYCIIFSSYLYHMEDNALRYIFFWQDDLYYLKNDFLPHTIY